MFLKKIRYIRGTGVELRNPTRQGIEVFLSGEDYDITHPLDYNELIASGDFIDVTPKEVVESTSPETVDAPAETNEVVNNKKGNK